MSDTDGMDSDSVRIVRLVPDEERMVKFDGPSTSKARRPGEPRNKSRVERRQQSKAKRRLYNLPARKAPKKSQSKEARVAARKKQREERRERDRKVRKIYGDPEPDLDEDDRDLPGTSTFKNPGMPADYFDSLMEDEADRFEFNYSSEDEEDDYSYKKKSVKSEVVVAVPPPPTEQATWKSLRPLEIEAMNFARKTSWERKLVEMPFLTDEDLWDHIDKLKVSNPPTAHRIIHFDSFTQYQESFVNKRTESFFESITDSISFRSTPKAVAVSSSTRDPREGRKDVQSS